jgi:hypothetical protein
MKMMPFKSGPLELAAPLPPPLPAAKKCSHALPLSLWLKHEKEGEWVG